MTAPRARPLVGAVVAVALALVGLASCTPPPRTDGGRLRAADGGPRRITIVDISDWHGQVGPVTVSIDGRPRPVGGAAALTTYFARERARNPGRTLVVTAGDAFGATPPESSLLEDVPAVEAQNAMGIDVDTLGNHNFDAGLPRLTKLMGLARFAYVIANVVDGGGRTLAPATRTFTLDGIHVGVIGIANPDTPVLVTPGSLGPWRFLPAAPVVNEHAAALRRAGAHVVVVIAHVGASAVDARGAPLGALGELGAAVHDVDVLIGDHTDVSVNARVGDLLVVENRSRGLQYAVVDVDVDVARGGVARASATQRTPFADAIAPDAGVQAMIDGWRAQLRPLFDVRVGAAASLVEDARAGESPLGSFVADAVRHAYGVQLVLVNTGALRDTLPSAYRPASTTLHRPAPGFAPGPPWDLVRGDVHAALPFGNVVVTFRTSGRTVWAALEHGLADAAVVDGRLVTASGRFPQISGFAFRFDATRPRGRRVIEVRLLDGTPVAPDDQAYTAATLDYVYRGGDGYTMLDNGTGVTREPLADVVARAIAERGTIAPKIEGRIVESRAR